MEKTKSLIKRSCKKYLEYFSEVTRLDCLFVLVWILVTGTYLVGWKLIKINNRKQFSYQYFKIFCCECYLVNEVANCEVVYDLGCNMGLSAYWLFKKYQCEVVAIDVDLSNLDIILPEIKYIHAAVGSRSGVAYINENENCEAVSISNCLDDGKVKQSVEFIDVEEINNGRKFFLKMDVEGAEYVFLKEYHSLMNNLCVGGAIEFHGIKDESEFNIFLSEYLNYKKYIQPIIAEKTEIKFSLN
jgi:FkbM family methyltransferase